MTALPDAAAPPAARLGLAIHPHLAFVLAVLTAIAWGLVALYFGTGSGSLDLMGYSKGQDFINVWTAGHLALDGRAAEVFDPARFRAATSAYFHHALPPHFWSYPPTALFAALPLGFTDYWTGFALWSAAGLAALGLAAWRVFPDRRELLLFMASPAVALNFLMGQNGCLTAALWMGGVALAARPAGGVLLGLLTFKPQLGLLIPLRLLAERRWRTIAIAAATAAALAAAALAAFGPAAWSGFLDETLPTQAKSMSVWQGPYQWFMPSAFMGARLLGAPAPIAMTLQAALALVAAGLVWRAARRGADPELQAALLFVAAFLATPQSSAYDMIPTAAAALVLARRGGGLADAILASLLWVAPWATIALNAAHAPVIPLLIIWAALRLASLCEAPLETAPITG